MSNRGLTYIKATYSELLNSGSIGKIHMWSGRTPQNCFNAGIDSCRTGLLDVLRMEQFVIHGHDHHKGIEYTPNDDLQAAISPLRIRRKAV